MILETSFLIDLERERRRGSSGPATAFLEARESSPLAITFTIAGELAAGIGDGNRRRWEDFVRPFRVLPCTEDVCWEFGRAFRFLSANGWLIGTNDLWIGATCVAFDEPVVTANVRHFGRIPGLEVLPYRDE